MSFKKFLITEADKKVSAKQFTSLCKTLDTQYTSIQKILDTETIRMSGNPNVSGMLNKLQGAIQKACELCVKVVEAIEERHEDRDDKESHIKDERRADKQGDGAPRLAAQARQKG